MARKFLVRVVRESFSDDITFDEAADCDAARGLVGLPWHGGVVPEAADRYRLILCDLEQPGCGGIELLAALSDYPAIKIATTLHSDDEHLFPALQCGADGYLLKEDRFEVLVEELQKVVRGQPSLSPAIARRLLGFFRQAQPGREGARTGWMDTQPNAAALGRSSSFGVSALVATSGFGAEAGTAVATQDRLNPRENEVLTYLSKGFTLKEVARHMGIKWFAVNDHIRSVYAKLSRSSDTEEAVQAGRQAMT
ncbi:DNA-binding NarL/FixJ family response regulator [Sphaerotilus hippei]|uniref:DNA-binding NarL/FixJ family response regulator n=2 Tax=Sphaerotilus hippei TaxID=744406 RepID=A0A318H305_9BURK|nr:DNA-binding NarL/FixJ family response regulator [Sphaerotilus hippei]